ncbi:MAG TPA: MopE-related protein [Chitinophagales bacterium]|nr:MopE-related protein [Chitinophagales bacterium]HRG29020.1 MopE-related protein [Chitinophagales bacterium]HRG85791.1 MopE-related protein [Chitinophagales bacterium]HRH51877.1 MopE-related protein [Chitinophagales bacterium]
MKNNYLLSLKSLFTASVMFLATGVFAQTNPTPQTIPYFEDFSGLTHASTTYPMGLQGWKVSSAATTVVITGGPTADHTLTANSSASSNAGGVHNYNGKIGTLASGSTNPGLVLALNTTGYNNITLSYDIMVIRNPYDGASNTRLNEATLQYRIGTTGAFTAITGVEYQSGTTQQTASGVTTPQDLQARSIVLPVACENQAEIQIRWITHDMTGAGSRPSFAIDNINVDADNDGDTFLSTVDCNDNDATIYPGATEICNFIDDDCNTITDDGITYLAVYDDLDGDTYGAGLAANYCTFPGAGYSLDNLDCDDSNVAINPAANEICNGVDDNCDGNIDEITVTASISPAGVVTTCKNVGTTLTANSGDGYTYQWFKNGNLITGATDVNYTTSKPAYYQVEVSAPGACPVLSEFVEVNIAPNPNANITTPNGLNLCLGTVKLKASYGVAYTYQWYLDAIEIPGATDFIYLPATTGNYTCLVTNEFDCSRLTNMVTVINVCKQGEDVAMEIQNEKLVIYPNPVSNVVTIDVTTSSINTSATIMILNVLGEVMYSEHHAVTNGALNANLNVNNLSNGAYVVAVNINGEIFTTNMVVE